MTEKQEERLRKKIKNIKLALAADKRQWGGCHRDGRGLRYLPLEYYIKLKDYSGGKRYVNWFFKNFPDDVCYPNFLFECSIIFFYSKKLKDAQKKLFETFASNTYVIDQFLGNDIRKIEKFEYSYTNGIEYLNYFKYSSKDQHLNEFTNWVNQEVRSVVFESAASKLIEIQQKLHKEKETEKRRRLLHQERALVEQY